MLRATAARARRRGPRNAAHSPDHGEVAEFRECLAGAPGFEPGNGGVKIRCLTTWLRPNAPRGYSGLGGKRADNSSGCLGPQWLNAQFCAQDRVSTVLGSDECLEIGVGTANENADPLARHRSIGAARDGGEGRGAAWLGDDRIFPPQRELSLGDGGVLDQNDAAYEALGDIEIEFANPPRSE